MKLGQNVCLDEISDEFENGLCRATTGSLRQILDKSYVHFRGHVSPIIMKLGQNVCLDGILHEFENG